MEVIVKMLFYRYQNTNTMEDNSIYYIDIEVLYREVIDDYYNTSIKDYNFVEESYLDTKVNRYSYELIEYRGLSYHESKKIIHDIIVKAKYDAYKYGEKNQSTLEEIRNMMYNFPLKGIFTIPVYSEQFEYGCVCSHSEMACNIYTVTKDKPEYIALYEGDVICDEMEFGGTLIKPKTLIEVKKVKEHAEIRPYSHCQFWHKDDVFAEDVKHQHKEYLKYIKELQIINFLKKKLIIVSKKLKRSLG